MPNRLLKIFVFALFTISILACGIGNTAKEVISENTALIDKGVTMYRNYQGEAANYYLQINGCTGKMDRAQAIVENYANQVNANTEAWTGNFRDEQAQLAAQMEAYNAAKDPKTGVVDPSKLDLAALAASGALPNGLGNGLNLYFNSVVQAPPPEIDSALYQSVLDVSNECYDSIIYSGTKVNEKAIQYNTWHDTVEGKIVTEANEILKAVSEKVGFDLPVSLPLMTGASGASSDQIP